MKNNMHAAMIYDAGGDDKLMFFSQALKVLVVTRWSQLISSQIEKQNCKVIKTKFIQKNFKTAWAVFNCLIRTAKMHIPGTY